MTMNEAQLTAGISKQNCNKTRATFLQHWLLRDPNYQVFTYVRMGVMVTTRV